MTPEGGTFKNQIQTKWMCYNCFVLWCVSGSKAPLACVWHEEWFYTAGPMPQDGVGGLADGEPWVSMPLSRNGFTMPTRITFLVFRLFANVSLTLITSWLLTLYARSALCIMVNCICMASKQLSEAKLECSLTPLRFAWWKLISSLLMMLTDSGVARLNKVAGHILGLLSG